MTSYDQIVTFFSSRRCQGIENIGNSCYISTSLTCLAHCLSFVYPIIANTGTSHLTTALRDIYKTIWIEQRICDPRVFIKTLAPKISDMIDLHHQNDAMEFIMLLFDILNKEYGTERPKRERNPDLRGTARFKDLMDCHWVNTHRPKSFLCNIIYGQTANQTTCALCGNIEHLADVFCNISLDVKPNASVQSMLGSYFEKESVLRDCDNCKLRNVQGIKVARIWKTPQILTIHMKRFDPLSHKKTICALDISEELDMDSFTLSPKASTKYLLKAIACHSGNTHYGHYFCIVKNPTGQWFIMDDEAPPREIESYRKIDSVMYYILFYEQI